MPLAPHRLLALPCNEPRAPRYRRPPLVPTLLIALGALLTRESGAYTFVVPDDFPSVNQALEELHRQNLYADTVLVRGGTESEHVVMRIPGHVYVIGIPDANGNRPKVASVRVADDRYGGSCRPQAENLHILGHGIMDYSDLTWEAHFVRCTIDSGLALDSYSTPGVWVRGCTIGGDIRSEGNLFVDSCSVDGSIRVSGADTPLMQVTQSVVSGGIAGARLQLCMIEGNATSGITIDNGSETYPVQLIDNEVRSFGASPTGISVRTDGGPIVVAGNRVTEAQAGITIGSVFEDSRIEVEVLNNRVLRSAAHGISIHAERGVIAGNVVGRSGVNGIDVHRPDEGGIPVIQRNTVFANSGAGIRLDVFAASPGALDHNIGFGNGTHGLQVTGAIEFVPQCNDWFGNGVSDVSGIPVPSGDLSIDPRFCDVPGNDVTLSHDSPLLAAEGCGLIGALGEGCALTATLVTSFHAEPVSGGILIEWQIRGDATASEIWIERATQLEGPWVMVGAPRSPASRGFELDASASPASRYWYRLVARDGAEVSVVAPPIEARALMPAFDLVSVAGGSGKEPARIRFSVGRPSSVTLDVFDLQGRNVASVVRGFFPAGEHSVDWLPAGPAAASGMYWVRFRHPEGQQSLRFIRAR